MTPVIEFIDYNYNNTGQKAIFYRKAQKTATDYTYDIMSQEIYQLTPQMTIIDHRHIGLD